MDHPKWYAGVTQKRTRESLTFWDSPERLTSQGRTLGSAHGGFGDTEDPGMEAGENNVWGSGGHTDGTMDKKRKGICAPCKFTS